jgi:hypothetical protein
VDATVLVQLDAPSLGGRRCEGWKNVETAAPLQLAVVADVAASNAVAGASRDLFDAMNAVFQASGAMRASPRCQCHLGRPPWGCISNQNPITQRYLIYVSDGTTAIDPQYITWLVKSKVTPIPILPVGTDPAAVLPAALRGHVALFWAGGSGAIAALAPRIIARATPELGGPRLFISYRHAEAAAIAGQLFDALSHAGFDVFLDRFRGHPGQDFMERIREELIMKRCILVLETPDVHRSSYVIGEVATARRFHLGLMAVDLPGSRHRFRDIAVRLDLRTAKGVIAGSPASTLPDPCVDRVVADLVERYYVPETSKRWSHQRRSLQVAAATARLAMNEKALGLFEVSGKAGLASCTSSVLPLESSAFKRLDDLVSAGARILFGPLEAQGRIGRSVTDWLATKTGIMPRDEGRVLRTMHRLKRGSKV